MVNGINSWVKGIIIAVIIMISMYITKKIEVKNSTGKGGIIH